MVLGTAALGVARPGHASPATAWPGMATRGMGLFFCAGGTTFHGGALRGDAHRGEPLLRVAGWGKAWQGMGYFS